MAGEPEPGTLEARLVRFTFRMNSDNGATGSAETVIEKTQNIPRTVDVYRLKGIVGRLFGIRPMRCRLIWETDEWDPVKSEDDGWSCSEEDEFPRREVADERSGAGTSDDNKLGAESQRQKEKQKPKKKKKKKKKEWTRRELELEDSTREVGFWIEVRQAIVRVERR